jgi:hypothetical protein
MQYDDIRQLTRAQPFKPFRIFLTTGETFDIRHPDMILPTRGSVHVAAPSPENPTGDGGGSVRILSFYHIQKIEFLVTAPLSPGSNGPTASPGT